MIRPVEVTLEGPAVTDQKEIQPNRFNWQALNSWLTLGANIAVVLGLVLLIIELNQNQTMMRAQTRHEMSNGIRTLLLESAADENLNSIIYRGNAGEPLDPEDAHAYNMRLNALLRYWEDVHYQYRMGLYDEDEFAKQRLAWQNSITSSARAIGYWCSVRRLYSSEFADEMNGLLAADACEATANGDG